MATHSSILAWKIPWTEEPGRLQSLGLQKSRTRLSDFTSKSLLMVTAAMKLKEACSLEEKLRSMMTIGRECGSPRTDFISRHGYLVCVCVC